jgi:O-antigen ligase
MPARQPSSPTDAQKVPATTTSGSSDAGASPHTGGVVQGAIFFFLCLFAILLPHSIKGSQHAWQIAFLLWLVSLAVTRKRPYAQPLTLPLLAFIVLSGISTALSPDPALSWDRMKIVCLLLVGIVVAQGLSHLKQVRTLVCLLILSGVAAVGFTAWQYTYGVGVCLKRVVGTSPLYAAHVYTNDIIRRINGEEVHTPQQLQLAVERSRPGSMVRIDLLRGYPFHARQTFIRREQFLASGLGTPSLPLGRGHPQKAQGTLGHYVDFAVMLMQIACMAFAMMLAVDPSRRVLRALLGLAAAALAATLMLTEVRAALGALAVGGLVTVLMLGKRHTRIVAIFALGLFLAAAALWIHHTRGSQAFDDNDPGTQFRTMMWEDGFRLMREHPWFGVGMETIRNHWMQWDIRAFSYFHDESHFHNDFIQIAVERGLPAMLAWLWFVVAYLVFLFRLIRRARRSSQLAAGVATGVLASFVALELTSIVHYNLGIESVAMTLYFYFGLAVAIDRMLKHPETIDVP